MLAGTGFHISRLPGLVPKRVTCVNGLPTFPTGGASPGGGMPSHPSTASVRSAPTAPPKRRFIMGPPWKGEVMPYHKSLNTAYAVLCEGFEARMTRNVKAARGPREHESGIMQT